MIEDHMMVFLVLSKLFFVNVQNHLISPINFLPLSVCTDFHQFDMLLFIDL